jgi:S-formylglutathione hydrolase FrmB
MSANPATHPAAGTPADGSLRCLHVRSALIAPLADSIHTRGRLGRMKPVRKVFHVLSVVALSLGIGVAATHTAKADENLMVPSAAMGRDIPVTFRAGGPHAVFLLDAFNAGDSVSNWVTAGGATTTLAGKGISMVAPAGGAWSMYTDWEQDGSKQWETFLSRELPDWLAANKGLAPGGHGIVGAAQGGTAALAMAEFHPDRFRYAGSFSGFLTPSAT